MYECECDYALRRRILQGRVAIIHIQMVVIGSPGGGQPEELSLLMGCMYG